MNWFKINKGLNFILQKQRNAFRNIELKNKLSTSPISIETEPRVLQLNDLQNIPGAKKKRKRWGRGTGSGRGKTCGHGHQKSRSTPRGFEGGQTPLYKRLPKIGFHNHNRKEYQILNLSRIQDFIDMGRFVPKKDSFTTIRDLYECGLVNKVCDGIKLLAKGKKNFRTPVHFEVSQASSQSIKAVEKAGGTVTCVHLTPLSLRALLKPLRFTILPWRARPNPSYMPYYSDVNNAGFLSPEIQIRNIKLFGHITSEKTYRNEHERIMKFRRDFSKRIFTGGKSEFNDFETKQLLIF